MFDFVVLDNHLKTQFYSVKPDTTQNILLSLSVTSIRHWESISVSSTRWSGELGRQTFLLHY